MQLITHADSQRRYKLSEKGKIAQGKYYKSEAKKVESAKYRANNPEKIKAHSIVAYAIRSGKLKRLPCRKCGSKGYAHHDDYSQPLMVKWLCNKHHFEYHQMMDRG